MFLFRLIFTRILSNVIQHFAVIGEILGSLISTGSVAVFFGHVGCCLFCVRDSPFTVFSPHILPI